MVSRELAAEARRLVFMARNRSLPDAFAEMEKALAQVSACAEAAIAALPSPEREPMREALEKAIETLAASRHLIAKYTPLHHWLPEHDERIAALKAALAPPPTQSGDRT